MTSCHQIKHRDSIVRILTLSRIDRQSVHPRVRNLGSIPLGWRFVMLGAALLLLAGAAFAQQEEKPKIPGLDKIISANEHLAFTGSVKSVDEKHNILSVS